MHRSRIIGTRVETHTEPVLQTAQRRHVRPATAYEEIRDRLTVDATESGDTSQTQPLKGHLPGQGLCDRLHNPGLGLVNERRLGPVLRVPSQLPRRPAAASSSGHAHALLTVEVHTHETGGHLCSHFRGAFLWRRL